MSGKLSQSSDFSKISEVRKTLSRNVHPTYWEKYIHNQTQLLLYSSVQTVVMWSNSYYPVKPLDIVFLKDVSNDLVKKETEEAYSGKYIVAKVANRVQHNRFASTLDLVKDSFNFNEGRKIS